MTLEDDVQLARLNIIVNDKRKGEFKILDAIESHITTRISLDYGPNKVSFEVTDWCGRLKRSDFEVFLTHVYDGKTEDALSTRDTIILTSADYSGIL